MVVRHVHCFTEMGRLIVWIGLLLVSAGGVIATASALAFERVVAADMRARAHGDVDGVGVLTPWIATPADYRLVDGMRIPFQLDVAWELPNAQAASPS